MHESTILGKTDMYGCCFLAFRQGSAITALGQCRQRHARRR